MPLRQGLRERLPCSIIAKESLYKAPLATSIINKLYFRFMLRDRNDRLHGMETKEESNANLSGDVLKSYISDGTTAAICERYGELRATAAQSDYGEFDNNLVVIDTETTGFSLNHDELTQIAAARVENGKIVKWYITFVNPGKPIPEEVAHLTDIHDEDVRDAPSPEEALAGLVEFVGTAKLVAHNAEFDRNFTTKHPSGYPLLENVWIDSLDLARIALPRMKSHRLLDLVRAFGLPPSTHRADADVAATCGLFRILLAAVDAMPKPLVAQIARMNTPEQWPTSVVFSYFASASAADNAHVQESFSLLQLRRDRVGSLPCVVKTDADAIARDPSKSLVFPTSNEIEEAFSSTGLVGGLYESFESRSEQVEMSQAVRDAFASSANLMVEAGTGVGKSMAYLVPAALTALRNNITVGVATKTNALLDQLVYHELPALAAGGLPISFSSLKGFSHYPCLRRIGKLVEEGPRMRDVAGKEYSQAPSFAALLSFVEQTEYDDIDALKIDYRVLPRKYITTTSSDCLRRKCPYFGRLCFVHGARRRAEAADVVVTNHSLLFCDLATDGGLLPPVRYWVVDEAHGAEAEARRAFALSLSADEIRMSAQRTASPDSTRNMFVRAERCVAAAQNDESSALFYALSGKARQAGSAFAQAANEFADHMRDLLFFDTEKHGKGYDSVEIWLNDDVRASSVFAGVASLGKAMSAAAEKLITGCQEVVGYLEDVDGAAVVQREIASCAMGLKDMVRAVDVILDKCPENYVYSAMLNRKGDRISDSLDAYLVNVGDKLGDTLYANSHSVVFASATLSVDGSFEAFRSAMGLTSGAERECRECKLDSSYDYDTNMVVYVASDIPEPNEVGYLPALQRLLVGAHRAQHGSMLTLFTNRREMEKCFDVVQPELKADDLRLVCQKWGVSVKGLRDDFLADEHLSLFALKSFWEGFDAPGATLKGVIIPKLPFSKPTDPLSCERAQRDDNAWRRYVLPAAVLETKQAAGRLIRKADDTGVLILADRRLVSKRYGKSFLNSLPSKNIKVCSADEIVKDLSRRA